MPAWYARLAIAFSFLTRLRLPGSGRITFSDTLLRGSVAWYPAVGLFYGLVNLGWWLAGHALGVPGGIMAAVLLACPLLINRFLHFDGLCDTLDGFLADRPPERRLEIMKDSRNGSFAMGGAVLILLAKYAILEALWEVGGPGAAPAAASLAPALAAGLLFLAPVVSRWLVLAMAWRARYPREGGTAFHVVGHVSGRNLVLAGLGQVLPALAGTLLVVWLTGTATGHGQPMATGSPDPTAAATCPFAAAAALSVALLAALAWTLWLRRVSRRKIGGVTGDVLGCLVETAEGIWLAAGLAALVAAARLGGLV
jgi:adenosylcobinamide-GDP ribazoletransferase